MADLGQKWGDNKPGKIFVDQSCIACDACVVEAQRFFVMNDIDGHAYVVLQPKTTSRHES